MSYVSWCEDGLARSDVSVPRPLDRWIRSDRSAGAWTRLIFQGSRTWIRQRFADSLRVMSSLKSRQFVVFSGDKIGEMLF
jgi:hypothetical protein